MSKSKKTTTKYGLQITKPFSKAMYDHNDQCAQEMKKNILEVWKKLLSKLEDDDKWFMDRDWNNGDNSLPDLLKLQENVCYSGYGDGYTVKMVNEEFVSELENMANWQLHENYYYMCFKGLVPRTVFMMVGFDWEKCDYDGRIVANGELTSDFADFEGEIEVDWVPGKLS